MSSIPSQLGASVLQNLQRRDHVESYAQSLLDHRLHRGRRVHHPELPPIVDHSAMKFDQFEAVSDSPRSRADSNGMERSEA